MVVCRHNKPIAELRPIPAAAGCPGMPRFGLWEGFGVAESFFEPLPEEMVQALSGE